MAAKQMAGG